MSKKYAYYMGARVEIEDNDPYYKVIETPVTVKTRPFAPCRDCGGARFGCCEEYIDGKLVQCENLKWRRGDV